MIENLRRLAVKILKARRDRFAADALAAELAKFTGKEFSVETSRILAKNFDGGRLTTKFSPAFLVQFSGRLHEGEDFTGSALEKLELRLRPEGTTLEHLAHREHNRQAAAQVSVSNIITSMRLLSNMDWREFFESVSLVESCLREDPANAYSDMDFATRDSYRRQIERIAKRSFSEELKVAARAIELSAEHPENPRRNHIGYYLDTDQGLSELEKSFDCLPIFRERVPRFLRRHPSGFYLTLIGGLTFISLAALVFLLAQTPKISIFAVIFSIILAIIPARINHRLTEF